jgi:tRNA (guanine37-N1)-methyltransferase
MQIDIITVLPQLLSGPFEHSILQRAQTKGIAKINLINLRDYSTQKQKSVDDYAYGGGAGMVMTIEPIANCIEALKAKRTYQEIIYMTPAMAKSWTNRWPINFRRWTTSLFFAGIIKV